MKKITITNGPLIDTNSIQAKLYPEIANTKCLLTKSRKIARKIKAKQNMSRGQNKRYHKKITILYLGTDSSLIKWLKHQNESVMVTTNKLTLEEIKLINPEWIISYGYRHIIKSDVINAYHPNIINLHISMLPYGRGADCNYWSWIDNTPKGVTIHQIDKGIDTGDILAQAEVPMGLDETLASSYERLKIGMEDLFKAAWKNIRRGKTIPQKQKGAGSYHRIKDRPVDFPPFSIPVKELICKKG